VENCSLDYKIVIFTKRFKVQKTVCKTANCSKGFKRFQAMNKGLIKRNDHSFKSFISSNGRLALFCDSPVWTRSSKWTIFIIWNHLKPFEQFAVCTETVFWTLNCLVPIKVHYMEKNPGMFSSKTFISFRLKKEWHGWMTWGWVNHQQKFFLFIYLFIF